MICKFCGNEISDTEKVCPNCGNAITEEQQENLMQEDCLETTEENEKEQTSECSERDVAEPKCYTEASPVKKNKKKIIIPIIAGGAVLLVVAIVAMIFLLGGTSKKKTFENQPLVYVKEDCTMISPGGKSTPFTALDERSDGEIKTSDDGKHVFYTAVSSDYSGGSNLYYRRIDDSTATELLVSSKVAIYDIPEDGSYAVYLTEEEKLYFNNLKESKLLAEKVSGFIVCEGGKYIIYITDENRELYLFEANINAEPQLIDNKVEYCDFRYNQETEKYCYDDGIYYKKDGKLYYKKHGKEKVTVINEVGEFYFIGKTLYATTCKTQTLCFDDVVTYDCEEDDKNTLDNSPRDSVEYKAARFRNLIKEAFGNDKLEQEVHTLYQVNGSKTESVKGKYLGVDGTSFLIEYSEKQKLLNLDSVDSSELYDEAFDILLDLFEYESYSDPDCYLSEEGNIISLKNLGKDYEGVFVTENEKYVYSLESPEDADDDSEGRNLNKYNVKSGEVVFIETLAENVEDYVVLDDDFVVVYMYVDDEYSIGVYDGSLKILAKQSEDLYHNTWVSDSTVYFVDNEETGNLLRYVKGKGDPQVVAEKVSTEHFIMIRSDNECYYIKNAEEAGGPGELYYNKDGKEYLIDEDVYSILSGGMLLYNP